MDTTGFSQIGRYGTLSLVKRATAKSANTGASPTTNAGANQVITSFGVDNPSLTFGRNLTCDVRLYYPDVEGVHARVVWEDEGEKGQPTAALYVLGESGVYVLGPGGAGKGKIEGKWVYPRYPDEDEDGDERELEEDPGPPQPTIVELPNNAEFEIAHKRFRVTYPPRGAKARDGFGAIGSPARGPMLNTPTANKPGQQRRAIRLSMIHSAQVFSPRPSADPKANLRVLQSPLKVPATPLRGIFSGAGAGSGTPSKTPARPVSPLKFGLTADVEDEKDEQLNEEPEDQEIILVHTNHPRVVEEDKDLVILEDVPLPLVVGSSSSSNVSPVKGTFFAPAQPQPQQTQLAPPVTPRRKSLGGTALHRAVLIRSAQRAVWKAERERVEEEEEREEEMEVLDFVVDEQDSDEDNDDDDDDVEMRSVSDDDSDDSENEEQQQKPLWRKSLEKIIPWRFSSKEIEDEHKQEEDDEHEEVEEHNSEEDEEDEKDVLPALQERTPVRRALGSFMTPQHPSTTFEAQRNVPGSMGPPLQPLQGRFSLGGGEARRVIVQQPWRVKDLVVPPPSATSSASSTSAQPHNAFPTYRPAVPQLPPRTPIRSVPVLDVKPGITPRLFPPAIPPGSLPQRVAGGSTPLPALATPRTPALSAEERKAIQERRRSAVKDAFVLGGGAASIASDNVPGMSPSKTSPAKPINAFRIGASESGAAMPRRSLFPSGSTSPTKGRPLGYAIPEHDVESGPKRLSSEAEEEEEVSTNDLLEQMRETVEVMKRRRSLALGVGSVASTPARGTSVGGSEAPGGSRMSLSPKKLDFARLGEGFTTPESETVLEAKALDATDQDEDIESAVAPPPLPSLLRPPARSNAVPVVRVEVVESVDKDWEPAPTTKAKPTVKARLLRAPVPEIRKEDPMDDVEDKVEDIPVPIKHSSAKPPSRSRIAATTTNARSRSRSPLPPAPIPVARSSSRTPVTPTEETDEATLVVPKTRSARSRSRSKTPQPSVQIEKVEHHPTEVSFDEEVEVEAKLYEEEEKEKEAKPLKKPTRTRGGASNRIKPTEVHTPVVAAPSGARSRSRVPVPAPVVDDEPQAALEPEPQVTKSSKSKATKGRANKPNAAPSEDEMDEDDELGSYEVVTPAPSAPTRAKASTTKKTTTATKTPVAAAKPPSKIASGSRSTGTRRTRLPVQVKQEEEEAEPEQAPVAKRSTSKANTKARTPSSTPMEEEPQPKPPAKRGRPRKNDSTATPATPVPVNEEEEKENTPGPSASDEAEEQQQVVKVRVSRRTVAAGGATTIATGTKTKAGVRKAPAKTTAGSKLNAPKAVDQEDEQEEVVEERKAQTGSRPTRVMRLRTRTG